MQAQGFVRFRVDGTVRSRLRRRRPAEAEEDREAQHRRRHRPHQGQRPTMQAAPGRELRDRAAPADGRALALRDGHRSSEHLFSSKFACPICGYSLPELEPRLFSFNTPMGACPDCDGLGHIEFFDPKRVVAFPTCRWRPAPCKGWDRRNQLLLPDAAEPGATHYDSTSTRRSRSCRRRRARCCCSAPARTRSSSPTVERARPAAAWSSASIRSKASCRTWSAATARPIRRRCARNWRKLPATQACPTCDGTRLRTRGAQRVPGRHRTSARSARSSRSSTRRCATAWPTSSSCSWTARKRRDRRQGRARRSSPRLTFLNDVGLDYLTLDRSADTLSGGEAQRIRLASQIGSGLTGVMYVLDEPSIGLHQRDNDRLIATLQHLRDLGNTRARRRARRGRDPRRRLRRRHGPGRRACTAAA